MDDIKKGLRPSSAFTRAFQYFQKTIKRVEEGYRNPGVKVYQPPKRECLLYLSHSINIINGVFIAGKSVRLPPDPQATIYDWLFLKKVARKTKKTKHVKTEVPYNYEDCKPKREWSNNEDEYDSDDCSSHGILLKALQRKAEWGIHLKELRATIETFRIGIKNRVSEMRKRPKRRHRIDKKKGIALQRVFNRNCCEEMLKWLTETSDEMSNQQANC